MRKKFTYDLTCETDGENIKLLQDNGAKQICISVYQIEEVIHWLRDAESAIYRKLDEEEYRRRRDEEQNRRQQAYDRYDHHQEENREAYRHQEEHRNGHSEEHREESSSSPQRTTHQGIREGFQLPEQSWDGMNLEERIQFSEEEALAIRERDYECRKNDYENRCRQYGDNPSEVHPH